MTTEVNGHARAQPNMSDVARRAGVALGTVSNTLNNPEKVAEKTRRKVLAAIDELGFTRNDQARSLAAGRSSTIGLVVADLGNSLFVDIARGAERAARAKGMNLLIADSAIDAGRERTNLQVFEEARVAGILCAPLDAGLARSDRLPLRSTPAVLVNFASSESTYSSVVVDERMGGTLAARHLLELGRKDILFVGGKLALIAVGQRCDGARAAVEAAGGRFRVRETTALNVPDGRSAARALLEEGLDGVDGIVAASDLLAIGLIQELAAAGISVPADIAITGYDDNHLASEGTIPVTTVAQPGIEMGRAAAELLLSCLDDPNRTNELRTFQPRLIPRASSLGDAWTRD